jgi:tRNA pseudouridine38-40 synthase
LPFRYFIHLSYKGTNYHGWQIQPGSITVQEVLNQQLSILLREEIYTIGAGRTDTGVHASCFYAHFDSIHDDLHANNEKLIYRLNCLLPFDIAVHHIYKVSPEAHARFSALSRTYIYRITNKKDPFTFDFSYYYTRHLDIEEMNHAAQILLAYTDFTSFSKLHTDVKTNDCCIKKAYWEKVGNETHFYISADRFLRNMVRAIVGTSLSVGEHKITTAQFRQIIENKNRSSAGVSVAAKGLQLIDLLYPGTIFA